MKIQPPRILRNSYALAKRSGFLETSVGSQLFSSAYFLYKRYVEDGLQFLLRSEPSLLKGGNALDVGANIGYTAKLLARALGPGRCVYAFEPEPFNHAMLRRVASQPEFHERIIAVHSAVGAKEGTVQLWLNSHHHADHRVITDQFRARTSPATSVSVPMVSIDGFLKRNPGPVCLIKIDVQGFELPVCEGMSATLERNPNVTLILEYAPSDMRDLGFEPSRLIKFLTDRGFECSLINADGTLSPGVPNVAEDGSYVDLLFRRYPLASGGDA
jgi:FkbM family methyltransferase